jgi:kanamycin kinase
MEIPTGLAEQYATWSWTLIQHCDDDVATWRVEHPRRGSRYAKIAYATRHPRLTDETARTRWAATFLPVATVVDAGNDGPLDWQITHALPGRAVTDARRDTSPAQLVRLLARGLRQFHDTPIDQCPFDFRLATAMTHVHTRVEAGLVVAPRDFNDGHEHLTEHAALAELERRRPDDEDLVVCHGDYCPPNILVSADAVTGFVDLGELAVADRWWDLAVATWSVTWNFGPGCEDLFLATYAITRDQDRIAFYRLLYDLAS